MEVENKRAKLGKLKRFIYDLSKSLQRRWHVYSRRFGIWSADIRYIESRFGSGVVSYFILFRWVFVMNIFLGLIWYTFVISFGTADMFFNNLAGWKQFYYYNAPANASLEQLPEYAAPITYLIGDFFSGTVSFVCYFCCLLF